MNEKQEKPGVMIYFSVLEALPLMSNAEKGMLFEAILRYAKDGEVPNLDKHRYVKMVWKLLKPSLDADNARYYDVTTRRRYAAYVRWSKEKGQKVLDYDDWVEAGEHKKKRTYLDADNALA